MPKGWLTASIYVEAAISFSKWPVCHHKYDLQVSMLTRGLCCNIPSRAEWSYMSECFFYPHSRGWSQWKSLFWGEWRPPGLWSCLMEDTPSRLSQNCLLFWMSPSHMPSWCTGYSRSLSRKPFLSCKNSCVLECNQILTRIFYFLWISKLVKTSKFLLLYP
jgi:hypothetical protein